MGLIKITNLFSNFFYIRVMCPSRFCIDLSKDQFAMMNETLKDKQCA